nr:reverse transcriptase domain-containing protein [Tanacetum cinerariifolium]
MANTTPIVTTVTKTTTKEKTLNGAETVTMINILDFCEEHYDDILPVMDKIRRDKRREVHIRPEFGENSRKSRRIREGSQNSSAKTLFARYRNPSERPHIRNRLRNNDGNVFDRLGHRRERRSSSIKRERNSESLLSRVAESSTSEGGHWKSKSKRRKPTEEEDLAVPWSCGEVDLFTPRIWTTRVWFDELPPESIDGYTDLKAAFLAYFKQQKKYVKDHVEIHNIKQKDGETIEEFIKRFKTKTGHMKGAPKCMRISRFMHGVNNPELIKRLNEHVLGIIFVLIRQNTNETRMTNMRLIQHYRKLQD